MKRLVIVCVVLGVLGSAGYFVFRLYQQRASDSGSSYRLATVQRQDVVSTISATGTVVPEDVVDVGAQVNGLIASFGVGTDDKAVDYRSTVTAGSVLAKIDDAIYAAQVSSDEASLAQAQAAVRVGESTREQARARLEQAQRDWGRTQKLGESQALSQVDFDTSKSNFDQATASLAVAEAQIGQARAQVSIAEAALQRSRRNLFYCTIKSPVDGVIIDRRVEIGQTVVSSLNAPSLFLIAKDLSRMQVLVQVNEADIGRVKPGESVTFAVDAFPGDRFRGDVRKVRLNATMTQNVVTYTVEIVTENADLKLLPYLTANVRFLLERREQVLAVPNSALRWSPVIASTPQTATTDSGTARPAAGGRSLAATGGNAASSENTDRTSKAKGAGTPRAASRVWVVRDGIPAPINVQTGLSDGAVTEIITDELEDGDEIIIGQVSAAAAAAGSTNPFAPQMFRGGGGGRPAGGGAR